MHTLASYRILILERGKIQKKIKILLAKIRLTLITRWLQQQLSKVKNHRLQLPCSHSSCLLIMSRNLSHYM